MKKLLIATTVALATAGTAGAADLPTKAPPMVAAAPIQSWTGCYISGGIGYGMWNQDESVTFGLTSGTYTNGGRGWLGRGGVGCDYQFSPSFVVGAFGDYDWANIKSNGVSGANFTVTGAPGTPVAAAEKENRAWHAGLRLGYLPYPNLMTFVSGGWTQAHFTQRDYFSLLTGVASGVSLPDNTYDGWFLGGGTEYRLPWWQGLTWKTEYRFAQYKNADLPAFFTTTGIANGLIAHDEKFVQTVTTSLVWRFNFGGPVVARY
jgi:outer membrane immunogenic protein